MEPKAKKIRCHGEKFHKHDESFKFLAWKINSPAISMHSLYQVQLWLPHKHYCEINAFNFMYQHIHHV